VAARVTASGFASVPQASVDPLEISVKGLKAGGYTAKARIGAAPPSRHEPDPIAARR